MVPTHHMTHSVSTDAASLKDSHAFAPTFNPRVKINVIRERIRLASRYRRYVILVSIHDCYDLYCSLLQGRSDSFNHFGSLWGMVRYPGSFQVSCWVGIPISVFGVARVTSRHHDSQQTSSSFFAPLVNQPNPAAFLLFFSKNSTTSEPLTLLFDDEVDDSCRIN